MGEHHETGKRRLSGNDVFAETQAESGDAERY